MADGKAYGLLINYEYCTGCGTCEMACSVEHDIPIEGKRWQNDIVPIPTDECDLCAKRVEKGKKPTCVKHCQALCMEYGVVEDLAKKMVEAKTKYVLFVPKSGTAGA